MQILGAWLLGIVLGAFVVRQSYGRRLLLYERWYKELKRIIKEHYGGKIEDDIKKETLFFKP